MNGQREVRATAIAAADQVWIARSRDQVVASAAEHVAAIVDAVLEVVAERNDQPCPVGAAHGRPRCGYCGPGYRIGDEGCRHTADPQVWERRLAGTDLAETRLQLEVDEQGRARVHEAVLAQLLVDAGWERTA